MSQAMEARPGSEPPIPHGKLVFAKGECQRLDLIKVMVLGVPVSAHRIIGVTESLTVSDSFDLRLYGESQALAVSAGSLGEYGLGDYCCVDADCQLVGIFSCNELLERVRPRKNGIAPRSAAKGNAAPQVTLQTVAFTVNDKPREVVAGAEVDYDWVVLQAGFRPTDRPTVLCKSAEGARCHSLAPGKSQVPEAGMRFEVALTNQA